ncbi:HlyC/CorC family transporter [Nakamurella antarctica]|uniref:HlyC/CorC family transporter n=1 Tax=Nakamurella antarctica TaxID=1902245 RepID=A0A3G8ZZV7_9ACTN|nr:HlyC/CorC family transporter [Nakamurella antarctica]
MDATDVVLLIIAAALVPLGGLCAAADAAFTMASSARVEELHREGRRGAASFMTIVSDRPRYTNLLLLLRVAAELTATVLVSAVALSIFGFNILVGLVVIAVMIVVSYVVIGVLPRTLGRQHPYNVGLASAGLVKGLGTILSPVTSVLILGGNAITPGRGFREGPFSSEIELRELVDMAGDRGVVEETEREMLQSVFALGDTIVREVMVPRTEVVWIESNKTVRQALHLCDLSGFSRIPVIGENADDILGVVYLKDMVKRALYLPAGTSGPALTEVMRAAQFVPESKNVDALLREMQRDHTHFAVVIDEYGGAAGVVTIEDILEEIVGEITDEYDADTPDPIEHLADGSVRVSAKLSVEDLGDIFNVELPSEDVETVGGLLGQLLGRVPLAGAEAWVEGLLLRGEPGFDRRNRPRVQSVVVRRLTPAELAEPVPSPEPSPEAGTGNESAEGSELVAATEPSADHNGETKQSRKDKNRRVRTQ